MVHLHSTLTEEVFQKIHKNISFDIAFISEQSSFFFRREEAERATDLNDGPSAEASTNSVIDVIFGNMNREMDFGTMPCYLFE